ncbi:MAG: argininosuccinate synthase [Candidatus Omnitrophica bacterium CG11_big_fil_rev_8_21_14_0_20_42_13]|uniref:Argininosuccinate synthase n=1 Tax=Candidatus Ghiorseimicrobium undicola TaxID=1974746 RepID=A0A2H0LW56_9BACT|nr:MAG: argininosuccinate synthase [Candidatus Omnitrophica bacterium CG11_big_fil_rev_8_21_14_0_20_42_13]
MKKVVLAYSGGLDTSVCVKWLKDRGYEVVCFIADVGQGDNFSLVRKRALKTGASKVYVKDLKKEFISGFIFPALCANAVYEGKYFLATALSRPLIGKYLVDIAKKEGAGYIAHGCTGKGNDQVRIEVTAAILAPKLKVVAPVRVWEFKSREEEMDYAREKKIPVDITRRKPYSLDKNIWGVSIECGVLEDPWKEPPDDAYQMTKSVARAASAPKYIEICFEQGIPCYINGKYVEGEELLKRLNKLGGDYGVGRSDLVESRLVGIKSREVYEAPAAVILSEAHRALENLVLDRDLLHFKEMISLKYSELIYNGLWYSPLKLALDKFISQTQKKVTGTVRLKLHKGNCSVVGRRSDYSLYKKELATYSKEDKFDQSLAEGFIKIWAMPFK